MADLRLREEKHKEGKKKSSQKQGQEKKWHLCGLV
jgi:hypothetical protein